MKNTKNVKKCEKIHSEPQPCSQIVLFFCHFKPHCSYKIVLIKPSWVSLKNTPLSSIETTSSSAEQKFSYYAKKPENHKSYGGAHIQVWQKRNTVRKHIRYFRKSHVFCKKILRTKTAIEDRGMGTLCLLAAQGRI